MFFALLLWAGVLFCGAGLAILLVPGIRSDAIAIKRAGVLLYFGGCAALFGWALFERHSVLAVAAVFAAILGHIGSGGKAGRAGDAS